MRVPPTLKKQQLAFCIYEFRIIFTATLIISLNQKIF
jgi:hypothetical protein